MWDVERLKRGAGVVGWMGATPSSVIRQSLDLSLQQALFSAMWGKECNAAFSVEREPSQNGRNQDGGCLTWSPFRGGEVFAGHRLGQQHQTNEKSGITWGRNTVARPRPSSMSGRAGLI